MIGKPRWWIVFSFSIILTILLAIPLVRGHRPFWTSLLLFLTLPPAIAFISYQRVSNTGRFGRSLYSPLDQACTVVLSGGALVWAMKGQMPWGMLRFMAVYAAIVVLIAFIWNWRKLR